MKYITFDVMLNGRFQGTFRMPITLDVIEDYVGEKPVIKSRAFSDFVEQKRPSLKGKPYNIFFDI